MPRFQLAVGGLTLSAMLLLSVPLRADDGTKTASVASLQSLVAGIGLTDAGDKKTFVSVDNQGKYNLTIAMQPVEDGRYVLFFTNLGEIPADKMAALPADKMLAYNDTHRFYFSLGGDAARTAYLSARLEAATLTPQRLRERLDDLVAAVDETSDLWSPDGWKVVPAAHAAVPAPSRDYETLQAAADAAWEASPLGFRRALLVKDKVPGFGVYTPRPTSTYKNGDDLHLYVEPIYYQWKNLPDDKVAVALAADLMIRTKEGTTVLDAKRAIILATDFQSHIKTLDMTANITLEKSLAATDYVVTITVHDDNGRKTASADLPFAIAK